jgi:hypothetical protein
MINNGKHIASAKLSHDSRSSGNMVYKADTKPTQLRTVITVLPQTRPVSTTIEAINPTSAKAIIARTFRINFPGFSGPPSTPDKNTIKGIHGIKKANRKKTIPITPAAISDPGWRGARGP